MSEMNSIRKNMSEYHLWIIIFLFVLILYLFFMLTRSPTIPTRENTALSVNILKTGEVVLTDNNGSILTDKDKNKYPIKFEGNNKIEVIKNIQQFSLITHSSECTIEWCDNTGCHSVVYPPEVCELL